MYWESKVGDIYGKGSKGLNRIKVEKLFLALESLTPTGWINITSVKVEYLQETESIIRDLKELAEFISRD